MYFVINVLYGIGGSGLGGGGEKDAFGDGCDARECEESSAEHL